jgi:hypothetical protein
MGRVVSELRTGVKPKIVGTPYILGIPTAFGNMRRREGYLA